MDAYILTGRALRELGFPLVPDGEFLITEAVLEHMESIVDGWSREAYASSHQS
jgi:hypothetical protein